MAEIKKSTIIEMKEKLAELTEEIQRLFPNGKGLLVYELNKADYMFIRKDFNIPQNDEKQFKIDISGTEIVFILDELLNV